VINSLLHRCEALAARGMVFTKRPALVLISGTNRRADIYFSFPQLRRLNKGSAADERELFTKMTHVP